MYIEMDPNQGFNHYKTNSNSITYNAFSESLWCNAWTCLIKYVKVSVWNWGKDK